MKYFLRIYEKDLTIQGKEMMIYLELMARPTQMNPILKFEIQYF